MFMMCGVDIDDNLIVIIKGGTLTEPTSELNGKIGNNC